MSKLKKTKLATMSMPYAISTFGRGGVQHVIAATEDHGRLLTFSPPAWDEVEILSGPGGCMSLIDRPGVDGQIFTILCCFPGYKFHEAGVYLLEDTGTEGPWQERRLCDLPFAHRLEVVSKPDGEYLIAASLAKIKDGRDDWSEPGTVYATPLRGDVDQSIELDPVLPALFKNHGLLVSRLGGKRVLVITGAEGMFVHDLDRSGWDFDRVIDHEISEVWLHDLDGDGNQELVTIEPFHGNELHVYKQDGSGWKSILEYELVYGHGVWVGAIRGKTTILVGNRDGHCDLEAYVVESARPLTLRKEVIESGVGTANLAVVPGKDADRVFATNQATSEVAVYAIEAL